MQLPVSVSPVEYQPGYWATDALKLRPGRTPNFLSPQLQKAPQRRAYARVVVAGAALLLLVAMVASVFSLWQARQETAASSGCARAPRTCETRRQELQQRTPNSPASSNWSISCSSAGPAPVPVWFLGYLSEVVPPELAVTNLHLKREEDSWKLQMATAWQGQ